MATVNSGYQGWKVLEEYYSDDSTTTGKIKPNIQMISPQAVVLDSSTITFNDVTNVTPTGGSNNDIWYNQPSDQLYKKISGTWTLLTDRVINSDYVAPVLNTGACPLP